MKFNVIKDVLNILSIILVFLFLNLIYIYWKIGRVDLSILKSMCELIIDFFIPYQLPFIILFYYYGKYNN